MCERVLKARDLILNMNKRVLKLKTKRFAVVKEVLKSSRNRDSEENILKTI